MGEAAPASSFAIFGPTACGKSAVAEALAERVGGEVISADSAALYEGLEILTAAPRPPTRLVGVYPLTRRVSVGDYQRLAHAAIDEVLAAGQRPILAGGTGLYLRAALAAIGLPPAPAPGERERFERLYDALGPQGAHAVLAERDTAAAARVHPNDRRRVVRALELNGLGSSLAPAEDRLWSAETRHPTLLVGLDLPDDELERRVRARLAEMAAGGVVEEARSAWQGPLSETARRVLGLEQFATLPLAQALEETTVATLRLARYQRKWLRRLTPVATLPADRQPGVIADEIVTLAGTRKRLSRL